MTVVVIAALMSVVFLASARPSAAQTDPYTGGGVTVVVQVVPGLSISVTVAVPGERIRIRACITPNVFVRITLNPGTTQNPGIPCQSPGGGNGNGNGALGVPQVIQPIGLAPVRAQHVLLQAATTPSKAVCAFDHPTDAGPPDTTAGGGLAGTTADGQGCVDTFVTVPQRPPGDYELCAVAAGAQTVCAVIRISASSKVLGGSVSKGFARTGIYLLPLLLGALAAILVGRWLVRRDKQTRRGAAAG